VAAMNTVIQSYARTTLVAMVMKTGSLNFNTTSYSEDIHSIPVLWGVWGLANSTV